MLLAHVERAFRCLDISSSVTRKCLFQPHVCPTQYRAACCSTFPLLTPLKSVPHARSVVLACLCALHIVCGYHPVVRLVLPLRVCPPLTHLARLLAPVLCASAADTRAQFKTVEYTDVEYERELKHIEEVRLAGCYKPPA